MRVVVVCPGRGTYGRAELGSLARHHAGAPLLAAYDAARVAAGEPTITALDAGPWDEALHGAGRHAAPLIHAATVLDAQALRGVEVVAVTGNSMGWYGALAVAGALAPDAAFRLAGTTARLIGEQAEGGGQIVVPHMGAEWHDDPARRRDLLALVGQIAARSGHDLSLSIDLGGMFVLGGNAAGLAAFSREVTGVEAPFPLPLPGHAAFHTPLVAPAAAAARAALADLAPVQPRLPMIDGRGAIWWPGASDLAALMAYTLGHQMVAPYDFTRAITVAAREFQPDAFVVTGPGTTLGGAVAQALIRARWRGMTGRSDFTVAQAQAPIMISMARADQRARVT